MQNIKTMQDAEAVLKQFIDNASLYIQDGMTLERMWPMLQAAGNPHEKLRVIHVAGTSGKTSTAYYVAALLQASGQSVGLTVSPHVDSVTERIQIDGAALEDEVFCQELDEFLGLIDHAVDRPSFFELMMVFIMWVFVRRGVDYAVLETGLGGLLDSTNVVTRSDKVCVITDIGLDHMAVLGDTIGEIAGQKAGVIHDRNHVFMYQQDPAVMDEVQGRIEAKQAKLHLVDFDGLHAPSDLPQFQQRNYLLALAVAEHVSKRDGFTLVNFDPAGVIVPGRMERLDLPDGSLLIMDGAHNQQKTKAFVQSYAAQYDSKKAAVLLAMKQTKDYQDVIDELLPIASEIILTTVAGSQDVKTASQDPRVMYEYCLQKGVDAQVISETELAVQELLMSGGNKLVIGSFYLLGAVRKLVNKLSA